MVTSTSKDTAVIGGTSYDITYQTALKNSRNETVDYRVVNGYVVWSDSSATVDVSDYVLGHRYHRFYRFFRLLQGRPALHRWYHCYR